MDPHHSSGLARDGPVANPMLLGIGLFSAITATITSYFISQERPSRDKGDRIVERLQRLADLRREGS